MIGGPLQFYKYTTQPLGYYPASALTSAIRSVVVAAKHTDAFPLSHRHLGDVRHQVIGNAVGVFTDHAGLVGTNWIEIP